MKSGMSSHHSHTVVRHCEHTQVKIHTVAELLLLSGHFRPIKTENTEGLDVSVASAREQISSSLNIVTEVVTDIAKMMNELKSRWKVLCGLLDRLSDAVVVLVEICYYMTFHHLTDNKTETCAETALVDKYSACFAGLEIKLSCIQLKRARLDELTATFIMDVCSNISKYISVLTDNCRGASEGTLDAATRDQFKLGIKSVTCAAGSLIASIKSYKNEKSSRHHTRVVTFCEPVLAASHALVCLATEDEFIEQGRELDHHDREIRRCVFGPCMNLVSGCVQLCKTLRDYAHDSSNQHYVQKAKSCQHSVVKSTHHLKHALHKHLGMEFSIRSSSPYRGDSSYQSATDDTDCELSVNRESSPFERKSPQPAESNRDLPPFNRSSPQEMPRELSPFRSSPQEMPRELSPFRSSPQPGEDFDDNGTSHRRQDLSPRSTLAPSDISFATSSISR